MLSDNARQILGFASTTIHESSHPLGRIVVDKPIRL
jgi:hypothetical protein